MSPSPQGEGLGETPQKKINTEHKMVQFGAYLQALFGLSLQYSIQYTGWSKKSDTPVLILR